MKRCSIEAHAGTFTKTRTFATLCQQKWNANLKGRGKIMNFDYLFLILTFLLFLYFLNKLRTKKERKAFHGFAAGVFLMSFIYKIAPVVAKYVSTFFTNK